MIRYQYQPDDSITWATIAFDEDSGWWAGIQKCSAVVAIAATMALTAAQTTQAIRVSSLPQDDPAGSLFIPGQPDEDLWNNPVRPVPGSNYQRLPYFHDSVETTSIRDEDYWQNPVAPVAGKNLWPSPAWDQNDLIVYTLDEDYWQNPTSSLQAINKWPAPFWDQNDFIGYTLDEDYWINPVAPVGYPNLWQQPWFDGDAVEQQVVVSFQPDEDFWQQPVLMVGYANYQPLPYYFDANDVMFAQTAQASFVIWIQEDDS